MILKPCPVCENNRTFRLHSINNCFTDLPVGRQVYGNQWSLSSKFVSSVECLTCSAILDPAAVCVGLPLPTLGQDDEGFYVEGTSTPTLGSFIFKAPKRWYINTEAVHGQLYLEFMQIASAKTIAELPATLTSKHEELRMYAKRRMEELIDGTN